MIPFLTSPRTLKKKAGFTLIELLVVISIISLLSSVVLTALNQARVKALNTKAKSDLNQFIQAVIVAQGEQGKTLAEITGSTFTMNGCIGFDLRNIPDNHYCRVAWRNALTAVEQATNGLYNGLTKALERDPWGSPYGLDENQGEGGNCTVRDQVQSAGKWGVIYWHGDDITYTVPLASECP